MGQARLCIKMVEYSPLLPMRLNGGFVRSMRLTLTHRVCVSITGYSPHLGAPLASLVGSSGIWSNSPGQELM